MYIQTVDVGMLSEKEFTNFKITRQCRPVKRNIKLLSVKKIKPVTRRNTSRDFKLIKQADYQRRQLLTKNVNEP